MFFRFNFPLLLGLDFIFFSLFLLLLLFPPHPIHDLGLLVRSQLFLESLFGLGGFFSFQFAFIELR